MAHPSLGEQETALLHFIGQNAPVTVGQAASAFGEANGLARSTIETMMERLRKKGCLARVRESKVFRYTPTLPAQELMAGLVRQFVEQTLAGSLSPFVHYFTQQNCLTAMELQELERLVEKLQSTLPEPIK